MDLSNDESILDKFRETRDPALFKSLVRLYQNRIYNSALRILGNAEEAEEVVQETCIRLHQSIDKFNRTSSLASWVFRIAHNSCMDIVRNRSKRGMGLLDHVSHDAPAPQDDSGGDAVEDQIHDPSPGPAEKLDKHEQTEVVADMLKMLPESQRIVMVLHDVEGFSYQEVADIVGEKLGTVRSRIHYGRIKMRELLEPYYLSNTITQTSR